GRLHANRPQLLPRAEPGRRRHRRLARGGACTRAAALAAWTWRGPRGRAGTARPCGAQRGGPMVASAGGTALALTLTLALALALVLPVGGAAAQPWVQRQPKTLVPRAHERIGFAELVELHARKLGAWDRLALVAGAEPIEPSVYLTLLPDRLLVWGDEVLPLARGGAAPAELASCPPLCLPHLRDALSRALFAEAARVRAAGARTPTRILLLADSRLPYRTFLAAAYSAAHASVGGPPDLRL